MGVPPQRVQSVRGPSKAPPLSRNQSEILPNKLRGVSSPTSVKSAFVTSNWIEKAPQSRSSSLANDNLSHGLGKTERVLATNSRIKKGELDRVKYYLKFVDSALRKKSEVWNTSMVILPFIVLQGDSGDFNDIVAQFTSQSRVTHANSNIASSAQLRLWISALSHVVSQFDRHHSSLVESIVNMSWTTMDAAFVKSYIAFMGILVSAKTEFLSLVLASTIQRMTHHSGLNTLSAFHPETSMAPITRRMVYDRLHNLLQHLITVIPTLPSQLTPLILRNFPHKRLPCTAQTTYIRNVLRLSEYCHQLTPHILNVIVERALAIDVEIQVEIEELEEMDGTGELGRHAVFDSFDSLVGQDGDSDDSDEETRASDFGDGLSDISSENGDDLANREEDPATRASHVIDMVRKLDAILEVVFGYLQNVVEQDDTSGLTEDAQREAHFNALINIFQNKILKTFKSRYTQFLLFWFASVKRDYTDVFLGVLVTKALGVPKHSSEGAIQPDTACNGVDHDIIRCASASYLGSFVSRAAFIDAETARHVVSLVCEYIELHLDEVGQVENDPSDGQHALFYALCQALFLIFCFRWRDLEVAEEAEEEVDGNGWRRRKRWLKPLDVVQRMIVSELNPLKVRHHLIL